MILHGKGLRRFLSVSPKWHINFRESKLALFLAWRGVKEDPPSDDDSELRWISRHALL